MAKSVLTRDASEALLRVFLLGYDACDAGLSRERALLQFVADVAEPLAKSIEGGQS